MMRAWSLARARFIPIFGSSSLPRESREDRLTPERDFQLLNKMFGADCNHSRLITEDRRVVSSTFLPQIPLLGPQ